MDLPFGGPRRPSVAGGVVSEPSGRNNPLVLKAEPVEDGFAFFVRLTPDGDDGACHLQVEFDPILIEELREGWAGGLIGRRV